MTVNFNAINHARLRPMAYSNDGMATAYSLMDTQNHSNILLFFLCYKINDQEFTVARDFTGQDVFVIEGFSIAGFRVASGNLPLGNSYFQASDQQVVLQLQDPDSRNSVMKLTVNSTQLKNRPIIKIVGVKNEPLCEIKPYSRCESILDIDMCNMKNCPAAKVLALTAAMNAGLKIYRLDTCLMPVANISTNCSRPNRQPSGDKLSCSADELLKNNTLSSFYIRAAGYNEEANQIYFEVICLANRKVFATIALAPNGTGKFLNGLGECLFSVSSMHAPTKYRVFKPDGKVLAYFCQDRFEVYNSGNEIVSANLLIQPDQADCTTYGVYDSSFNELVKVFRNDDAVIFSISESEAMCYPNNVLLLSWGLRACVQIYSTYNLPMPHIKYYDAAQQSANKFIL